MEEVHAEIIHFANGAQSLTVSAIAVQLYKQLVTLILIFWKIMKLHLLHCTDA